VDRNLIVENLWIGREPERQECRDPVGNVDLLVLCYAEGNSKHEGQRFQGRDFKVYRALFWDDQRTLREEDKQIVLDAGQFVASYLMEEHSVLVTCHMGLNRSGLVAARAIHEWTGIPGRECVSIVRRRRPGALFNPAFAAWAESWK